MIYLFSGLVLFLLVSIIARKLWLVDRCSKSGHNMKTRKARVLAQSRMLDDSPISYYPCHSCIMTTVECVRCDHVESREFKLIESFSGYSMPSKDAETMRETGWVAYE